MSEIEELFALQARAVGLAPSRQVRVTQGRRWAWDFAIGPLLIDIQGGTWIAGRHSRGAGYQNDCDKANAATLAGYKVLRFTAQDVKSGKAINMIEQEIKSCEA